MKFIEMSGKTLLQLVNREEMHALRDAGIGDQTLLRVNPQGDIEVRQHDKWSVIGGLLGDFEARVKQTSGLDWA
jgi:hypothetical protein